MASTYSTNLAIELIGTGDQAGSWGNTTNTNLGTLIEQAISGYVTQAVSTGTDTTITIPNGATGVARNMYIELTGTGGTNTNLIVPANKKLYFIFNNSTGAVTVKVSGQTGVSVPTGKKMVLVSNGTDVVVAENYIADFGSNSATITNLTCTSLTLSNNPTLSGGTANGVLYLNGSKVATSGSALVFDGANLGIGTASPAAKLDVTGTFNGLQSRFGFTAGRGLEINTAAVGGTNEAASILNAKGSGSGAVVFQTDTAEQMRINSTGLGIGVVNPTYKIDLLLGAGSGNIVRFGQSGVSNGYTITTNGSALTHEWANSGSVSMAFTSSGNLGIGTTSPAQKLHVASAGNNYIVSSNTAGSTSALLLGSESGQNTIYSWTTVAGSTGRPLAFYTGASESMRLDTSGNLGIGTASPATYSVAPNLVVSTATDGGMTIRTGSSNYGAVFFADGTTGDEQYRGGIQYNHDFLGSTDTLLLVTAGTTKARLDSSGNLGLGVTPSVWIDYKALQTTGASFIGYSDGASNNQAQVVANAYFTTGSAWKYIYTDHASRYMQYDGEHRWYNAPSGTAGNAISFTQAATLDENGNFMVGLTSSTHRLQAEVASGADRDIFMASVSGASNGFRVQWVNSTSKIHVNIQNLPTSSAGLPAGTLWNDSGTLKVA